MASIRKQKQGFFIRFVFQGKRHTKSLKTKEESTALSAKAQVEETIRLVTNGRIRIPEGSDPIQFILTDGRIVQQAEKPKKSKTLEWLIGEYLNSANSKEENTQSTESTHFDRLKRIFGESCAIDRFNTPLLQKYVDKRGAETWAHGNIRPQTMRKELGTLQALFSWGYARNYCQLISLKGVVLGKGKDKEPFKTLAEAQDGDSVFLNLVEISDLLEHVKAKSTYDWLYPFFVCCAHTGARRSELLRAEVADFNFKDKLVLLREKKKSRLRHTFRQVPMSELLLNVMKDYLRGKTGRAFPVHRQSTWERFKILKKTKWKAVKGYHTFRHSFASNLAAAGIDQRIIDELMGHQTEEMRRRYRHLFPSQKNEAVAKLFG